MSRILPLDISAKTAAQPVFDAIKAKMGKVPNLFRVMGHSPAVLTSYLAFSDAMSKGRLSAAERESIAIAIAQSNGCGYCLSAHAYLGKGAGLDASEIEAARAATAQDPRRQTLLSLAVKLVAERGHLSDSDLAAARNGGLSDGEILEVVGLVALNILSNYVNHVAETEIDFPQIDLARAS